MGLWGSEEREAGMLISQKHTCMQEYTVALQTNPACFFSPYLSSFPDSPSCSESARLLVNIYTDTHPLILLSFIPSDECVTWTICALCHSITTQQFRDMLAMRCPWKFCLLSRPRLLLTRALLNYSVETLAKIATEPLLTPPSLPASSTHLYYLEP